MPNLTDAKITYREQGANVDLQPYIEFLTPLQNKIGSRVSLPLSEGDETSVVMRTLNRAAKHTGIRISRVPAEDGHIAFRIRPLEKRQITMSEEVREARRQRMASVRAARQA